MKVLINERLSGHTTFKTGGIVKEYYIPENAQELISIYSDEARIIGGGSNILAADHDFNKVIDVGSFNTDFISYGKGKYKVGASVRLQQLIKRINSEGYGGIEYLYSVPGLIGGATVMNAGRGKSYHQCISDYIDKVVAIEGGKLKYLTKNECNFGYRDSLFKHSGMVIVSVGFSFPEITSEDSERLIQQRIDHCRLTQDNSCPNFGSVFCKSNKYIMKLAKRFSIKSGNCHFSNKTTNWLLNDGGTFDDAMKCIKKVERMHEILGQECKREVIVWE
ncbi:FAD-binding protein [Butyrivibrio sp. XPD2006]|uniref:FAD-binding protein n=1 Tax=Butyrivibrio sp. XPD2006 TaxID=1280668 RepID=UPI0003B50313|nr:FAD-binding protein [Butyrivibrio sp. XPD2006]